MKKNILFFYLCIPFLANTQVREDSIISSTPTKYFTGLSLGVTNIIQNAVINGQNKVSNNQTFDLGLIFEKELNDRIKVSFRPGLAIGGVKNTFTIEKDKYSFNYPLTSFKAPLVVIYSFKKSNKFNGLPNYVLIGPEFNYNLVSTNSTYRFLKNGIYSKIPSFIKNKETQFKFGIGYEIKLKYVNFRPEFSYIHGFNVLKSNPVPNLNYTKIVNNQYSLNFVLSQRYHKVVYNKPKKSELPLWKRILRTF
jgi:hypothetical protein